MCLPNLDKDKKPKRNTQTDVFPELGLFSSVIAIIQCWALPTSPHISVAAPSTAGRRLWPQSQPAATSEILPVTSTFLTKCPQRSPQPIPVPERPRNKEGQLPFQSLGRDLRKIAIGATTPCCSSTTPGPSSAVKHKCAKLSLQSVCHNSHLSPCRSSGEICKNKHTQQARWKAEGGCIYVSALRTALVLRLALTQRPLSPQLT